MREVWLCREALDCFVKVAELLMEVGEPAYLAAAHRILKQGESLAGKSINVRPLASPRRPLLARRQQAQSTLGC